MPEIEWHHDRRRLIMRAAVMPPVGAPNALTSVEVDALLDTGATSSGLTPRISRQLDLPSLGKKPVQTASGLMQSDRYMFRVGFFSQNHDGPQFPTVLNMTILGIGLADTDSFDMIIGMDVIGRNRLEIRPDGTCLFAYSVN